MIWADSLPLLIGERPLIILETQILCLFLANIARSSRIHKVRTRRLLMAESAYSTGTSRNLLTGALFQAMPLMTMVSAIARTPFLAPSRQALIVWLKARRTRAMSQEGKGNDPNKAYIFKLRTNYVSAKDRRKHKKSKKAKEMKKIEEIQRIVLKKGIDTDSKEVSYTCQEPPDSDSLFSCQMTDTCQIPPDSDRILPKIFLTCFVRIAIDISSTLLILDQIIVESVSCNSLEQFFIPFLTFPRPNHFGPSLLRRIEILYQ
ncbi:hypothetical protein EDC96DRAFT_570132 [Choanephora cucurbitarum]|nr:hypothetical protein EDC96DRAFT_570132 [Choanephora cucurbitarum]